MFERGKITSKLISKHKCQTNAQITFIFIFWNWERENEKDDTGCKRSFLEIVKSRELVSLLLFPAAPQRNSYLTIQLPLWSFSGFVWDFPDNPSVKSADVLVDEIKARFGKDAAPSNISYFYFRKLVKIKCLTFIG